MAEPSPMERRLTLRLLTYWDDLRGDRPMPRENEIDPEVIADLWDNCFLIQVRDIVKSDYNYTYLGSAIRDAYTGGFAGEREPTPLVSPNASKLEMHYAKVIATCKPVLEEGEFPNLSGDIVKFRQCMLPLGSGNEVESIFGGMRFKIFPAK